MVQQPFYIFRRRKNILACFWASTLEIRKCAILFKDIENTQDTIGNTYNKISDALCQIFTMFIQSESFTYFLRVFNFDAL